MAEELLFRDTACAVPKLKRRLLIPPNGQITIPQNLDTLTIRELRRVVMPRLKSSHHAVLFDHAQPVRPACAALMEHLVENRGVPIIVAVRSMYPREIGKLWYVGTTFATIQVPELRPSEAKRLIGSTLDRECVNLPDREVFVKKLVSLARGNPRTIIRVCELVQSPRYQLGNRTNFRLLLLDIRIHDLQGQIAAEARVPLRGPVTLDAT